MVEIPPEYWPFWVIGSILAAVLAPFLGYRLVRSSGEPAKAVISGATTIDSRIGDAVVMVLQDIAVQQKRTADAAEKALKQMSQTAADEATRALIDRELSERLAKMQMEHKKK